MRTRLNETVEWTIFKHGDRVYSEIKAQLDHTYSYLTSYNVRSLLTASRIDIADQIQSEVYESLINAVRK